MQTLTLNPASTLPPLRSTDPISDSNFYNSGPSAKEAKLHHTRPGSENARLFFVGTATTLLEWEGIRLMTDPNFLHKGDHVHLGPGVSATRQTDPAINIEELPRIDAVLLSHYHADHFDQLVEEKLRRDLPIITTPHAKACLTAKGAESFTKVFDLDFWDAMMLDIEGMGMDDKGKKPALKITGMPGKHVPPGPLSVANDILKAVPPTNGWMLELGYKSSSLPTAVSSSSATNGSSFASEYRIYISGDTLLIDELSEIPQRFTDVGQNIDLMLIHLGGTTIPSPKMPLLMVTMDAEQGVKLMQLIRPDVTIPIHYDDYDVFLSPLADFKKAVEEAGLSGKVVYLDRKDEYKFRVAGG